MGYRLKKSNIRLNNRSSNKKAILKYKIYDSISLIKFNNKLIKNCQITKQADNDIINDHDIINQAQDSIAAKFFRFYIGDINREINRAADNYALKLDYKILNRNKKKKYCAPQINKLKIQQSNIMDEVEKLKYVGKSKATEYVVSNDTMSENSLFSIGNHHNTGFDNLTGDQDQDNIDYHF